MCVGAKPGDPLIANELNSAATPEFAEVRVFGADQVIAGAASDDLGTAIAPMVGPNVLGFPTSGGTAISAFIPRIATGLSLFVPLGEGYDAMDWESKLMRHSWLLDVGGVCEPSTRSKASVVNTSWAAHAGSMISSGDPRRDQDRVREMGTPGTLDGLRPWRSTVTVPMSTPCRAAKIR